MNYKKFLGAASAALMIVIVGTLVLAPAAAAADRYKVLHAFNGRDGSTPYASLIFDAAGNLYGTTGYGGDLRRCDGYGCGVVFKLTPNADGSWTESVLHSFNRRDGRQPSAALVFKAGHLYGTTVGGGAHNLGTVFTLSPNADGSWAASVLYSFNSIKSDGAYPFAGLIFDAAGNLYSTTRAGGTSGRGTVFKLTPNADGSWTESVLHSFKDSEGGSPRAGLIFDAGGTLYGTTLSNVFKLTANGDGSWTESVLHSFNGRGDGEYLDAGLTFDASGNLYGTTAGGGSHGQGTAFRLAPNADGRWTESLLHSFNGGEPGVPVAGLIFDVAGNLYGTASSGGSENGGAAFKLSPNQDGSWTYSKLQVFQGKPALNPSAGLVLGSTGTLYGTTGHCSSGCQGVVYQITP
jgi:uncharacterized repeat protein (TIGR03803 family)